MPTTDGTVQRKSSIKSKLRNISLNRHKAAHFEGDSEDTTSHSSLSASSVAPVMVEPSRSIENSPDDLRGRTQNRARSTSIKRDSSKVITNTASIVTATTANPVVSQAQLASPILTTPSVVSSDAPSQIAGRKVSNPIVLPASALDTTSEPRAEPVIVPDSTPASAPASGFLSSMINAATNFGTVLGTNSPRATPVKPVILMNEQPRTSNVQFEAIPSPVSEHDSHMNELSLRDMGLDPRPSHETILPPGDQSKVSIHLSPSSVSDQDAKLSSRRDRSGSVATTMSRRRRGSTSVSVFGGADGSAQKITGFAVASNKRNREFHATFRSVPDADYLLDDYGCALQKEILVHGRMYVSESHICFNSNIFGWVTNLVLAFTDITSLEKKSTAGIFPNAIQIGTAQAKKHVFASFISRDTTFDLVVNIWRLTHPAIQATAHGIEVALGQDDELSGSETDDSAVSDESDSQEDADSGSDSGEPPVLAKQLSGSSADSPELTATALETPMSETLPEIVTFPGPKEHAPTEAPSLTDGTAFSKDLIDETFEAPLGRIFELFYGSDTSFMYEFLETNQKVLDVQVGQFVDKNGKPSRASSYVKPLSGPIGPKQTRCLLEDVIEIKDFEKCVQVMQLTTTPDVPSGDAFTIKTRFCLMWGPRNTTRFVANCTIEWSKNSWIKGPIEKGCKGGQVQYMADIAQAIKSTLVTGGKKKKGKPKKGKPDIIQVDATTPVAGARDAVEQSSGGSLTDSILGIGQHINFGILTLILLLGMMIAMIRMQRSIKDMATKTHSNNGLDHSLATHQWRRAETDLWAWLAERTVPHDDDLHAQSLNDPEMYMKMLQIRKALEQNKIQAAVLEKAQKLATKHDL